MFNATVHYQKVDKSCQNLKNICSHFRHLTHLSSNDQFLCVPDNKMREKLYACSLATAAEKKSGMGDIEKRKLL